MAFALTKIRAYGIESEEPVNKRYKQVAVFNITAANTDIDLDFGDFSGTFWTAVGGTAPGTSALKLVKDIQKKAESFVSWGGTSLANYVKVLTLTAGNQYSIVMNATNTQLPDVLFNSGSAPTTYVLELQWDLKDAEEPSYLVATA